MKQSDAARARRAKGAGAVDNYTNRELSWLMFNQRVLMEASNPDNPVFEQMKFLSIVSSNLDEFFMVRVGSLRDLAQSGAKGKDPSGMKPQEQLRQLTARIRDQVAQQYRIMNEQLLPALARHGVRKGRVDSLTREQVLFLEDYFSREVYPVLTPMAVDASHHFPLLLSKSLNLAVLLEGKGGKKNDFATVQVPGVLPRVVLLPSQTREKTFLLLEQVIAMYIDRLFPGRQVLVCQPYRITRNADLTYDEEEAADLLQEIKKSLKRRKWGAVVRLECNPDMDKRLLEILMKALDVGEDKLFRVDGPLNLDFFMKQLAGLPGFDAQRFPAYTPQIDPELDGGDLFAAIRKRDRFFYHPYDSFAPVVRLVRDAARDDDVLAIKQTLYRVSGHSPIVAALAEAADRGKQVTVLLEVKARFDEENNIHWGQELEKAGCHVVYGLPGLKTHSKITLVIRREEGHIRRYTHLGTGNYNDVTARLYTDMGILTARDAIGEDASNFFNMVTGYSETPGLRLLVAAPKEPRPELTRLIRREAEHAAAGRDAGIEAKMNALVDPGIIQELYAASRAGVKIDLTVRGICCLQPGLPGLSENITVRSIVGRFLEHARIFHFHNGGDSETYLSSADWMPRNLDRRIELMFPVLDAQVRDRVLEILRMQQQDTAKAWLLHGTDWTPRRDGWEGERLNTQERLIPYEPAGAPVHTLEEQ